MMKLDLHCGMLLIPDELAGAVAELIVRSTLVHWHYDNGKDWYEKREGESPALCFGVEPSFEKPVIEDPDFAEVEDGK